MLSIGKIALGQHRYYEQQVAQGGDDYYSGRGEAPGEWVGSGAEALGLSGRVSSAQFGALIAGSDPRDQSTRLRASTQDPKVAAFDLTFSAPKSISVLFAVAPDRVSGELIACHEEAVRAALGYLEDTAVMVRRGHGGEHVERAGGLIAAAYRHRMSRALDPQLHTHVVAANLAVGSDSRFTALFGAPLYRAAKTAGFLYQAHLRALVSERLGLRWGDVHKGAAELSAFDRPVLEEFSKRRQEMLRAAEAGGIGLGSKAAAESAALATRDRKHYGVDTHTWREEVRARTGELGLGNKELADLIAAGRDRVEHGLAEPDAVDEHALGEHLASPDGMTARSNTFDERDVIQEFAGAAAQGALIGDVRAQAERFAGRDDVLATQRGEMTTVELVECERRLVEAVIGRAASGTGVVNQELAGRVIAIAEKPLTAGQASAVHRTVASGDGVTVIQALAGTGKTYTAGVLREVYERAGRTVLGVAPTGRAARELTEQAGIPARTIDRLLIDLEQLGDELPNGCVLILDEAGMAPTRSSARLLQAAEQAGAKVIAIGDPRQLASVQAGGWLAAVGRELGVVRLTEVMRQREPDERRALGALHAGLPGTYLAWAQRAERIETFGDHSEAQGRALGEWQQAVARVGPTQAVMIARDNETRAALNHAARELWGALGLLGESRTYGPVEIAVGDRVICRRNDGLVDVDNGMRGTVRHLDSDHILIDTDAGLVRALPLAYVAQHVEHAYALTGHGMQGGTVEVAVVVASPRDVTAGWSYTALSRAREETRLLIYEPDTARERSDFAPIDQSDMKMRTDLLARVERRMLERDDEDLATDQLPGAGGADDVELGATGGSDSEPARRARELRERIASLQAQLDALPARGLARVETLDERVRTLAVRRERLAERLAAFLDAPSADRAEAIRDELGAGQLTAALVEIDHQLDRLEARRAEMHIALGDPDEARVERASIASALSEATDELRVLRKEIGERAISSPPDWARETLGDRPDGVRAGELWERAVREAARYRAEYGIGADVELLGLRPDAGLQRRAFEQAHDAVTRAGTRLGRGLGTELGRGQDLALG